MSKTAIYLRQSLDRDRTKVSVDYQRKGLRKLCADRPGWDDPVEYLDRNVSASAKRTATGKRSAVRPAFAELCEDIRNGVVRRVAVWDLDRLYREPRELEDFIDLAEEFHVDLANVSGDVDLSTPSGRMFARMKGTVSKYEVEQKAVRQKAANAERARRGKAWVTRPFGYTMKVDKDAAVERAQKRAYALAKEADLSDADARAAAEAAGKARAAKWNPVTDATSNEIVEHEAAAIRTACRDLLNGATLWSIANQWNSQGLTTSKGYTWTGGQVRQVLLRPRNAGLAVYDVHATRGTAANVHARVLEGVETEWKPLVSYDVWESVCKLLSDPKRHTGKSPGRKYLLSGVALCGECGKPIGTTVRGTRTGNKRAVYQCKRLGCMKIARAINPTDEFVIGVVTERLSRPDAAKVFARPSVDVEALNTAADAQRAIIAQTREDYLDGLISARDRNARIERAEAKLAAINDKLLPARMSGDLKNLLGNPHAAEEFDALPFDRQRGVIDRVAVVTINRQKPGGRFDPDAIVVDFERARTAA
ncbi:recombinase family protein [Mycobacterium scrofulaceum]|uniref:Serine recombinase n=1 Tax=Mycobacterium scrofulaceum TaxID=1783 RepID=A0A1A2W1J4_MYCSC|nr:recombinase family protein [Mycobacterium scrofulaceum]OBI07065.1 hypothetical protein A5679_11525 [Mycobacterium scrofulaceum]